MKKICLWLVAAAIVVGLGVYFALRSLGPGADDARRPAQEQPETQQRPSSVKAPARAGEAEAGGAESTAGDETATCTVAGQVLDADGKPVADADVILIAETPTDEPPRRTTTDPSGRFRFDRVKRGCIYVVLKRPPLGAPWNLGSVKMTEKSAEELAKLDFTLEKAVTWQVKVQNEQRQPLAGASVTARSWNIDGVDADQYPAVVGCELHTDQDGLATFSTLEEGRYGLVAALDGYATTFEPGCPAKGDHLTEPYVITLGRPASIAGTVLAPDGSAVAEAAVACYPCDIWDITDKRPMATATCDLEGRFQLDGLRGGSYLLVASATGYSNGYSSCVSIVSGETHTGCTLTLNQDAEIAGQVIDVDKEPVAGATIEVLYTLEKIPITVASTTTGPDGRFRIEHRWTRQAYLSACKTGYEDTEIQQAPMGKPLTIVLTLGPTASILVTEAKTGKPVVEATVHCIGEWDLDEATTDEQGCCTITLASPGQQWFFATAPGLASPQPVAALLVRGKTTQVVLPLEPSQPIRGVVTNAATGKPIEDADLVFRAPRSESRGRYRRGSDMEPEFYLDEAEVFATSTDEQGLFEIEASFPELTRLVVEADGYCDETIDLEGRDLGEPLSIQLRQGAVLAGRVLTAGGLPVPEATVQLSQTEEDFGKGHSAHGESTTTSEDGTFRFGGLEPAAYRLEADHDDFVSTKKDPIELAKDQVIDTVEIVLNRGGRLSGTVIGPAGEPVHEATVSFSRKREDADEGGWRSHGGFGDEYDRRSVTQTDFDGRYTSHPLPPGPYAVKAYANLLICLDPLELTVAEGTVLEEINFALEPGSALSGTIVDENGAPVPGATLEARDYRRGNQNDATAEQDGTFTVSGFAVGDEVYLSASAEGYAPDSGMYTAPAHDIEITLDAALTLTGRVVDKQTQEPVELFSITEGNWVGWFETYNESEIEHHPDGRFELSMLDPDEGGAIQIVADGYAPAVITDIEAKQGEEPEELLVELVEGITLVLTATADGQPVADVEIKSAHRDGLCGRTDAYGRCVIEHLAAARHKFAAEHPEFAPQTVSVELNEGDVQRDVTVALDRGGTVRGRVVAKLTQQPVAGADVMLWEDAVDDWTVGHQEYAKVVVQTDTDGSFALSCIPPGRYVLRVEHADYALFEQKQRIGKGEGEPLLVQLCAGGRVVGTVTDTNSVPQRGAAVAAISSFRQAFGNENMWVETDEQGNYAIDHLAPGRYRVAATASGRETFFSARQIEWQRVVVRDGQDTRADFVLGGGAAVFGQVTRAGQPLTGGMIIIIPKDATVEMLVGGASRDSIDESGQYRIEHVNPGTYRLMIWADRGGRVLREFTMGTTDLRLDIQLGTSCITGAVYDNLSQPLAGAEVSLIVEPKRDGDEPGLPSLFSIFAGNVRTGETGEFSLDCDQPGTYRLYASADGYAPRVIPIEQRPNQNFPPLRIQLEKACTIGGKVRAGADELPNRMLVFVLDENGRLLTGDQPSIDPDTGEWQMDKVGPGRYTILAKATGYALVKQEISVTRGQDTALDLDLDEGHDLAVTVRDSAGRPVPGARVTVEMEGDPVASALLSAMTMFERGTTDSSTRGAEGRVVVPNLPKGECILRVQADGYEPTTTKARVTGDSGNVTVTLKPTEATGQ